MQELQINLPSCYKAVYKAHDSKNLVITFTPTNGFFLYHNDLNAHKICLASTQPNYYIFNPGSACKKLAKYISDLGVENIILIGSSKAGLASLLWGELLSRSLSRVSRSLPREYNVFVLSFSPQTLLYPFNDRLYFPSYDVLKSYINKNEGMKKCAINYGDINNVLGDSSLNGMVIYPKLNSCDKAEAERVSAKNIQLIGLDYPLHGSFIPFMSQAKDPIKLKSMISKIYNNAKKDKDIEATIPSSEEELLEIVKTIQVPTIEELCKAIFFKMSYQKEITNFNKVSKLGFV